MPAAADEADPVVYSPPVEAQVTDPFRPPPQPWLPGNRGIEYATEPGAPVRAAGRGTVSFAGPVAGDLHVTVSHPDGIRTSYSFLARIEVVAGQAVDRGSVVGTAGRRLHVGARRGEVYIDPQSLWALGPPWVRLVPLDGGGGPTGAGVHAPAPTPRLAPVRTPGPRTPAAMEPGRGWLPRLLGRSDHPGRAHPSPHSSVRQRSPSGVWTG